MDWTLGPALIALATALLAALAPTCRAIRIAAAGLWSAFAGGVALCLLASAGVVHADGLSLLLVLLTSFVAAIVTTFSIRYLRADPRPRAYAVQVVLLVSCVLAFVASGEVVLFAASWLASGQLLASLIGHDTGWEAARHAARRARLTFLIGDTAVLIALGLLAFQAQSTRLVDIAAAVASLSGVVPHLAAALLLVAAMARSALPPFSGWLLGSMTAPTPVSALMHAGLVNAGGFLLIRFGPVLEAAPAVQLVAVAAGVVAAVWGTGILLVRPDVKVGLAGSTVAQMGFMMLTCGLGAYAAAIWHLIAHGLFKAWLFLGSGSAIGGGRSEQVPPQGAADTILAGGVVAVVAVALLSGGWFTPAALPLLLAIATSIATAFRLVSAPGRGSIALVAGMSAVAYGLGIAAVDAALVRPFGTAPGGVWLPLLLAALFLALWGLQMTHLRTGTLPPALYVRLMNAGRSPRSA